MRLLHFIQQDDGIRIPADRFGKLTAFIVTDISRRSSDQTRYTELLHIFGHIDPDDLRLIIKQLLGKRLRDFCLTDTGRSQEQEASKRTVLILDLCLGAHDRITDKLQRFILTHDAGLEEFRKMQDLLPFGAHQTGHLNMGPAAYNTGNQFFIDRLLYQHLRGFDLLCFADPLFEFRNAVILQFCRKLIVRVIFRLL